MFNMIRRKFLGVLSAFSLLPLVPVNKKTSGNILYTNERGHVDFHSKYTELDHHIYLSIQHLKDKRWNILKRYLEIVKFEFPEIDINIVARKIDYAIHCTDKRNDGVIPIGSIHRYSSIDIVKYAVSDESRFIKAGDIRLIFLPTKESQPSLICSGKYFLNSFYGVESPEIDKMAIGTVVQ